MVARAFVAGVRSDPWREAVMLRAPVTLRRGRSGAMCAGGAHPAPPMASGEADRHDHCEQHDAEGNGEPDGTELTARPGVRGFRDLGPRAWRRRSSVAAGVQELTSQWPCEPRPNSFISSVNFVTCSPLPGFGINPTSNPTRSA